MPVDVLFNEGQIQARVARDGRRDPARFPRRPASGRGPEGRVRVPVGSGAPHGRPGLARFHGGVELRQGDDHLGEVRLLKDLDTTLDGRHVVIVEDIVDTGLTLTYLQDILRARGPKTLRTACLLSKPSRRQVDVRVEYIGFTIEDRFVVGYGLDYAEQYRNLPYIGVVNGD